MYNYINDIHRGGEIILWYYSPFHAEIIRFIQSISNPILDNFFILVTMMGEETFFMVLAAVVFWCIDKDFGYRMGFAYLSNTVINSGIKDIFKLNRPIGQPGIRSLRLETAGGYSFPSGHSQCAASMWTSLMLRIRKRWMYIAGTILIILVAVSRLYLGVHWPLDVLTGAALGVLWVFVSNSMFNYAERTGKKTIFLLFIIPMLILLVVFRYGDYYKAAGTALAFYLGYIIEPKYIKYRVNASIPIQIIKVVIGLGVAIAIRTFVKTLLLNLTGIPADLADSEYNLTVMICDFFRYLLLGIWVTVLAPLIFKKLFDRTKQTE